MLRSSVFRHNPLSCQTPYCLVVNVSTVIYLLTSVVTKCIVQCTDTDINEIQSQWWDSNSGALLCSPGGTWLRGQTGLQVTPGTHWTEVENVRILSKLNQLAGTASVIVRVTATAIWFDCSFFQLRNVMNGTACCLAVQCLHWTFPRQSCETSCLCLSA